MKFSRRQNLTKVETLRLSICRVGGHLSAALGLGEQNLRRAPPAGGVALDGGTAQAQTQAQAHYYRPQKHKETF